MLPANCFDHELARANRSYLTYQNELLLDALNGTAAPAAATAAHQQLRDTILDATYPCIGAQCVMKMGSYRLGWYPQLASPAATAGLWQDLCSFVQDQHLIGSRFSSFFAIFEHPQQTSELQFEKLLWQQLQALHDVDSDYHPWDAAVSNDPANTKFAFSVGGRGFFIVGLHAGSSRGDRRFIYPTLIFNAQFMFDQLRAEKKYDAMKRTIRERTERVGLEINPSLANFGDGLAAPQYSGRLVEADWTCPLQVRGR